MYIYFGLKHLKGLPITLSTFCKINRSICNFDIKIMWKLFQQGYPFTPWILMLAGLVKQAFATAQELENECIRFCNDIRTKEEKESKAPFDFFCGQKPTTMNFVENCDNICTICKKVQLCTVHSGSHFFCPAQEGFDPNAIETTTTESSEPVSKSSEEELDTGTWILIAAGIALGVLICCGIACYLCKKKGGDNQQDEGEAMPLQAVQWHRTQGENSSVSVYHPVLVQQQPYPE